MCSPQIANIMMTPAAVVLLHKSLLNSNLSCKEGGILKRSYTGLRMRRLRLPLTSGWQETALRLLLIWGAYLGGAKGLSCR